MQLKSSTIGILLLAAACGGQAVQSGSPAPSNRVVEDIPDWVMSPPKDTPERRFSSGIGESRDMSIAFNSAETDARNKLAQGLQSELKSLDDKFQSSVRGDAGGEEVLNMFRQAVRTITNQSLSGTRVAQRKMTTDPSGATYRAYVLMELDNAAAKRALMDRIKADEALYTRFRASQAFADLDAEIRKIEEGKKTQMPPQS